MVARGDIREDLFYRLNVLPMWMPPLRARPRDIRPLAERFCAELGPASGKPAAKLDGAALEMLAAQPWPGNVRQLQNFVERLIVLSDGPVIGAADVRRELARRPPGATAAEPSAPASSGELAKAAPEGLDARRKKAEREALEDALRGAGGNRSLAARLLGVSRRTLYNKLDELKLGEPTGS